MQDIFPIKFDDAFFTEIETVPNYEGERQSVQIIHPEFSCVCPKTGYPDFGSINLRYVPNKVCVELKAWKLYLSDFYGVGIFHEKANKEIANEFVDAVQPRFMTLVISWGARGGLKTVTGLAWSPNSKFYSLPDHWQHPSYHWAARNWSNS